jgi:hypothetical protein
MIIGTICTRDVCTCTRLEPLVSAARAIGMQPKLERRPVRVP